MNLHHIKSSVFAAFRDRCAGLGVPVNIYENPTEEVREAAKGRKPIKLFAAGGRLTAGGGAKSRLEENYLFDTRRFTSGALAAGSYLFFQNAVGASGVNNGFATGIVMSEVETNMDVPSQIAQGKDYVLTSIGVTFNADIVTGDVAQLMEAGALRFSKQGGQYTLKHGPVKMWPGGMGVSGYSTATSVTAAHNGLADIRATRKLAVPRILRSKDTFNYSYEVPRAVSNLGSASGEGAVAWDLDDNCLMTVWLWGGQQDTIPV